MVDEAARRVLRVKFALGLFDHPYADETPRALRRHAGQTRAGPQEPPRKRLVLLKNGANPIPFAGKTLPIAANTPAIALIGPLADSQIDMLGSWSAAGDPKDAVTLRTALQARCDAAKTKLNYAKGTEILTDSDEGFDEAPGRRAEIRRDHPRAGRIGAEDDR